jgi:uncharacterized protein YcfL
MKKWIPLLLLLALVLVGCSQNQTTKDQPFEIIGSGTGIGGVDQTFDKQKLTFNISIANKDKLAIKEDSIKIVLSDWTKKRLLENKLTEVKSEKDTITVKGYVIFDSKGLSKDEIMKQEPLIQGVEITTKSGKESLVKYPYHQ